MKTIFEGRKVLVLENDGWEYIERKKGKSAVAVVALTEAGELILTEQLRRPVEARVIDLPAGLVGDEDESEGPEATVRKELREETGYECGAVELLAEGPTSPGITSELVGLWRAHDVRRTGKGGGVEGEEITVHLVPRDQAASWLRARKEEGLLVDLKVWGALSFI